MFRLRNLKFILIAGAIIFLTKDYIIDDASRLFNNAISKAEGVLPNISSITDKYDEILEKQEDIGKLHEATLVRVVDGDTIIVSVDNADEIRVRLIGIDTPESVNPDDTKNNEYGQIASSYTKELLEDIDTVYLEYDEETEDQYGRTLAYVWLKDIENTFNTDEITNYMLNAIIVENGYAVAKEYAPNTLYSGILKELMQTAQSENKGLWSDEGYVELVGDIKQ